MQCFQNLPPPPLVSLPPCWTSPSKALLCPLSELFPATTRWNRLSGEIFETLQILQSGYQNGHICASEQAEAHFSTFVKELADSEVDSDMPALRLTFWHKYIGKYICYLRFLVRTWSLTGPNWLNRSSEVWSKVQKINRTGPMVQFQVQEICLLNLTKLDCGITICHIGLHVLFGSCAKMVGCEDTEQPSDNQKADTLPGCKWAKIIEESGVAVAVGRREPGPQFNYVFVFICILKEMDLVSAWFNAMWGCEQIMILL